MVKAKKQKRKRGRPLNIKNMKKALKLWAKGYTQRDIAYKLGLKSTKSIWRYLHLYDKNLINEKKTAKNKRS